MRLILAIEAECRRATTPKALNFLIANETRKLNRARQIFVFRQKTHLKLEAISGLAEVNQNSQLVQDIRTLLKLVEDRHGLETALSFQKADLAKPHHSLLQTYPFDKLLWIPFTTQDGEMIGGMLLTKEQDWKKGEIATASHVSEAFARSIQLLSSKPIIARQSIFKSLRKNIFFLIVGTILFVELMLYPTALTTMAPMEVTAHKPFIITAPFDGNIEAVLVHPSEKVKKGQALLNLSETKLRKAYDVATREVEVAKARLKKIGQLAFGDDTQRQQLRQAMADQELKEVEQAFARDMLEQARIKAQLDGIAVFANEQELIGKPVKTGDQIMQVADPSTVDIRIDIPVRDAIVLKNDAEVKVYLDTDPLNARSARIVSADYKAHETANGTMAFSAIAHLTGDSSNPPRIGSRGVAQIHGGKTALGLFLFRRPISAFRQWAGL